MNLKKWTLPRCYMGEHWPDYYVFMGRTRDSDALERANFDAALAAIGGEDWGDDGGPGRVMIITENHWAVGWVEWIAIHESATQAIAKAETVLARLESYPVVDEDLLSQYEHEEAHQVWSECYTVQERIDYIRKHRYQFEFQNMADMLGCVRGKYFVGYASELLG
jgi:hypothetical protein